MRRLIHSPAAPALSLPLLAGLLLGACAATDSGPVAGFDGSWTISKRGIVAQQPGQLTRSAVQKATAHCAASGKRFRQLDLKESPPGTLSSHAESELKFACE